MAFSKALRAMTCRVTTVTISKALVGQISMTLLGQRSALPLPAEGQRPQSTFWIVARIAIGGRIAESHPLLKLAQNARDHIHAFAPTLVELVECLCECADLFVAGLMRLPFQNQFRFPVAFR